MDGMEVNGALIKVSRVERKLSGKEIFELVGEDLKVKDEVKRKRAENAPPPSSPKFVPSREESPKKSPQTTPQTSPKKFPFRPRTWENEGVREVHVQQTPPPPPPPIPPRNAHYGYPPSYGMPGSYGAYNPPPRYNPPSQGWYQPPLQNAWTPLGNTKTSGYDRYKPPPSLRVEMGKARARAKGMVDVDPPPPKNRMCRGLCGSG